jgi:hypothetical protein
MTTSESGSIISSKQHKYGVIYANPPWKFRNWSAKGTGRNAVSHYDCLDMNELARLPVADLACRTALCLFGLWIHSCPSLRTLSEPGVLSTRLSPSTG